MSRDVARDFETERRVRDPVFQGVRTAIGLDSTKKKQDR